MFATMGVLAMPTFHPSRIAAVTVYRRGARVTRVVEIKEAATCDLLIQIGGLPLCLLESSVRVQVSGSGLVATDLRLGLEVADPESDLAPAESAELRAARRRLRVLLDKEAHLSVQRRRLSAQIEVSRPQGKKGEPPPPSPLRGRRAVAEFRSVALAALDRAGQELAIRLREAREELALQGAKNSEMTGARAAKTHEMRRSATIRIERRPGALGPRELRLEYEVVGARWAPAYTVTFDGAMSEARLALRAVVSQRTGEDWTRVRLALSTADSQRWTELPELQSMRIGRRQPSKRRRGWRPPPTGGEDLYADYDHFVAARETDLSASETPPQVTIGSDAVPDVDGFSDDDDSDDEAFLWSDAEPPEPKGERRKMKKGEAFGSASYGVPPPPPVSLAAAPSAMMVQRSRGGFFSGKSDGGQAESTGVFPIAEELAVEVEEDPSALLAYGDLRMPAATADRRGKLVLVRRQQRIRELVMLRESESITEIIAELDLSRTKATQLSELPSRHLPPSSVDGFDFIYTAEGEIDVVADGDFHGIPLLAREAEVSMTHVVVPSESTDVFRVATFTNPLKAPLLAGPADIYVGGDYLLTCDLALAPVRAEVRLGLGVEQAIKVSRNTDYAEEHAGLIHSSLVLKHQIAVEAQNHLDRAIDLEVRERVPSLQEGEDEISVEIGAVEPPWSRYKPEEYPLEGGQRWRIELAPGEKKRLRATYSIKISAKKELVGGNRREA
ncbi:MAG TPA: DUF4139 domain-containing protein [Nannocystis exedens]|nr:DUF4139 domain-containing protein [Nannocystis exedens]